VPATESLSEHDHQAGVSRGGCDNHGAAEGYWAVPVIGTILLPGGSSLTGYDYVVKKDDGRWKFIKAVAFFDRE
jgi:hypothetical protein